MIRWFMRELKEYKNVSRAIAEAKSYQTWCEVNYKQEQTKMTKEEAEKKLADAKVPRDIGGRYYILDVIEALGLIKFEEPLNFKIEDRYRNSIMVNYDEMAAQLRKHGYKIVKAD